MIITDITLATIRCSTCQCSGTVAIDAPCTEVLPTGSLLLHDHHRFVGDRVLLLAAIQAADDIRELKPRSKVATR